MKPVITVK